MKTDQAHRPRPSAEVRVINAHIQFISERSLLVFLLKMGLFSLPNRNRRDQPQILSAILTMKITSRQRDFSCTEAIKTHLLTESSQKQAVL
jgi:hypothetical protein